LKEITLRKYHRTIGIILAFFIFLQIGSGVLLILNNMAGKLLTKVHLSTSSGAKEEEEDPLFVKILDFIHFKGGIAGGIYRVILGSGLLCLAVSGCMIFFMIKARTKHGSK
jgi:hypothetical protein